MRLFLLLLLPIFSKAIVFTEPERLLKGRIQVKQAYQNMQQFCNFLNSEKTAMVCHEVFNGQLFPLVNHGNKLVTMIRLETGAFYKHQDEIIAHFNNNNKLIIPLQQMDVKKIEELQKTYNV